MDEEKNRRENALNSLKSSKRKNTRPRRDKGKKLITLRDRVVLCWIAEQYAARLDQVQARLSRMPGKGGRPVSPVGLTLSAVLQVVGRWVELGLVVYERHTQDLGFVYLTAVGLRKLNLPYAPNVPAESIREHLYHINRVRLATEIRHPTWQWISERTIRASLPRRTAGVAVPHIPDAQVWLPKALAVEVEQSPKQPQELDSLLTEMLITGSALAEGQPPLVYTTIWYFVSQKARRSIEQARERLPLAYQARVKILSLETLHPFPEEG